MIIQFIQPKYLWPLIHWGQNKMVTSLQTTFSTEFSWNTFLPFHSYKLTIREQWFRQWFVANMWQIIICPMLSKFYDATYGVTRPYAFNTLRPRQNGLHFADDIFKYIFLNEDVRISIKISLIFVPKDPINNIPALVQIMAWPRPGDKPLSESMMVSLLTHICVAQHQWVNPFFQRSQKQPYERW